MAATAAVAVAVAGCTSAGTSSGGGDGGEGARTLTLALDTPPTSFDPAALVGGSAAGLPWQAVYDTLLKLDADSEAVPNAAEDFELSEDNTSLTMTLREGMTFTDGSPVDAEAAKASIEYVRDGGGAAAARLQGMTVEVVDDLTLTVTSATPQPLLPFLMTQSQGALAAPASLGAPDAATAPVGSGPYVYDAANSTSGDTWAFTRNEDYWNADGYPYDTVRMRLMDDVTARLNALRSGQVNAAPITATTVAEAEAAGLGLVQSDALWAGLHIADRDGSTVPALADPRVRQAMNMVFDRPAILQALYQGQGEVTEQIFRPDGDAFVPELADRYPFDVEAARALMAEAGYADGFDLPYPDIARFGFATPIVVQQLGEIGIRVNLVSVPPQQVVPAILGNEFPVFYFALPAITPPFDVEQSLRPQSNWNTDRTEDPELSALIAAADQATGDDAAEAYQAVNEWVVENAWFAPWALVTSTWATTDGTTAEPVVGSSTPYLHTFR
ncbi:ABC transporter substrate-binding protein [Modestobacter roseus]|uniref:Peptide/nickel transport system substrate-binding protein n=1 Tax=Modestobacter roseus TaxID=1181884 RepID=A0A562IR27_9ACTN|nr:ABC transporter substrate-binding protein [Modestobacter roseus]MQA33184.1 peptide ABC transporter substrate-binding protein [Modestobacter roseus]TWH73266.1 peptide/nickel transport system substrate-binding protein [Modestobacter roseus]